MAWDVILTTQEKAMSAEADKRPEKSQTHEPAKGGLKPAHDDAYPSGDSPKAQGDKLQHAVDEAVKQKKAR
jgi:hypothetical protein